MTKDLPLVVWAYTAMDWGLHSQRLCVYGTSSGKIGAQPRPAPDHLIGLKFSKHTNQFHFACSTAKAASHQYDVFWLRTPSGRVVGSLAISAKGVLVFLAVVRQWQVVTGMRPAARAKLASSSLVQLIELLACMPDTH